MREFSRQRAAGVRLPLLLFLALGAALAVLVFSSGSWSPPFLDRLLTALAPMLPVGGADLFDPEAYFVLRAPAPLAILLWCGGAAAFAFVMRRRGRWLVFASAPLAVAACAVGGNALLLGLARLGG